jgi:hypothetical protein
LVGLHFLGWTHDGTTVLEKEELCNVAIRFGATHLIVSSTETKSAKDHYLEFMNFLDRNLPKDITLWAGGPMIQKYPLTLKRTFKAITTLPELNNLLVK